MMTFWKLLITGTAGMCLVAAAVPPVEARQRYTHYGYAPIYSYGPYVRGYFRPTRSYYGSAYGRACDPEILGHITRYSCEYRY